MPLFSLNVRRFQPTLPTLRWAWPKRQTLAWMLVTLAVVGAGVYYVVVKGESRSAINRWIPLLHKLAAGGDIYLENAFPTLPMMAMILYPFAWLPAWGPMAGWFATKVALTAGSARLWRSQCQNARLPITGGVLALAGVLAARPILGDLLHGNVNLFILFSIVLGLYLFQRQHDLAGGLFIALAAVCKITPALLIAWLLWKKAYRAVLGSALGLAVWLLIVPGAWLGFSRTIDLTYHWSQQMVVPYVVNGQVDTEQVNQSLPALLHRLTTKSLAIKPDDGRGPISLHLIDAHPKTIRWVWKILAVGILIILAWNCRTAWPDRQHAGWLHEASLILLATLLLSERSWKHHYVLMIPSLLTLLASSLLHWKTHQRTLAGLTAMGLLLATLAMASTSTDLAQLVAGRESAKYAQAYGAYVWMTLFLAGCHMVCLRHLRATRISNAMMPG